MNPQAHAKTPSGARTVAELMCTALYAVTEDESVLIAWELLERSGYRHLPVVRSDGRCTGLLDRADLAVACAAPTTTLSRTTVRELIQGHRPAQVHPGDTLHRAAVVLSLTGVDALVVADEHGRLAGLVTACDLVAAFAGRQPVRWTGPVERPAPSGGPHLLLPGLPPHRQERRTGVP
ncbi:CBS domain-containing protein [Kitasatospora sp. NPDC004669]|uniref:CBS domain-containing protein n=1 Tax=Kitasatospora sp. NPDC004669 TaxID=3154555 RepID=UPI0033B43D46